MKNLNFRAWHKENKRMHEVLEISLEGKSITSKLLWASNVFGNPCIPIKFGFDEVILMQSTGLKDSKGVEIFEGDILKINYDGNEYIHTVINGTDEGYPAFDLEPNESECNLLSDIFQGGLYYSYKVIGNIYEQPELLGGGE